MPIKANGIKQRYQSYSYFIEMSEYFSILTRASWFLKVNQGRDAEDVFHNSVLGNGRRDFLLPGPANTTYGHCRMYLTWCLIFWACGIWRGMSKSSFFNPRNVGGKSGVMLTDSWCVFKFFRLRAIYFERGGLWIGLWCHCWLGD